MRFDRRTVGRGDPAARASSAPGVPGKRTLSEALVAPAENAPDRPAAPSPATGALESSPGAPRGASPGHSIAALFGRVPESSPVPHRAPAVPFVQLRPMPDRSAPGSSSPAAQHRPGTGNPPQNHEQRENPQQLIARLQQLIRDSDWDNQLRPQLYGQAAEPIRERADARRQAQQQNQPPAVPDLTGLGSVLRIDAFVRGVKQVQKNWATLGAPPARGKALLDVCNAALQSIGVPPMVNFEIHSMEPRGAFHRDHWKMIFREQTLSLPAPLGDAQAAAIADTALHESRHCEQHFRVARYLAGQRQSAQTIAAQRKIPLAMAQAATKRPLTHQNGTPQEIQEAKQWKQGLSTNGQGQHDRHISGTTGQAIEQLADRRAAAQQALTDLQDHQTPHDLQRARLAASALAAEIATVQNVYATYRAIPWEADAHEVGVSSARAFELLP